MLWRSGKLAVNRRKNVKIAMTAPYIEGMNALIGDGLYESQTEIVKDALRMLFNHYEITAISDAYTQTV
jgi:Arc/MetJ-type ribon-helix-helix transcriptional regulator